MFIEFLASLRNLFTGNQPRLPKSPYIRQMLGGTAWVQKDDIYPIEGLRRQLSNTSRHTRLKWGREALQLLKDKDVSIRTLAAASLEVLPINGRALLRLLQRHPDLFAGVEAVGFPLYPPDLEDALYRRLAQDCAPGTRQALRERVRRQRPLLLLLAKNDGDWLVRNAEHLVPRDYLGGVLNGLSTDQAHTLLENLGPWPDADAVLTQPWWQNLEDADQLRSIIAANTHSPPQ